MKISSTHVIADAALGGLAQAASLGEHLVEALGFCRDAVVSAADAHYLASLAGALQTTAIVLARAGDAEGAARLVRGIHSHGYRIARRAEALIAGMLGPTALTDGPHEQLSMLDMAQLALESIDSQLAMSTATTQGTGGSDG